MGASGAGSDRWAIARPPAEQGGLKPRARCTRSKPSVYQGRATFAEVYLRQKKKNLYICRNLKSYNHGIFLSIDWAPVSSLAVVIVDCAAREKLNENHK